MRKERRFSRAGIVFGLGICLMLANLLHNVPSGYFVISPGPVLDLAEIVEIEGYPQKGLSFFMVSVTANDVNIMGFLRAVFDRDLDLWSKKKVLGERSIEEYLLANMELMRESQKTSTQVALNIQGIAIPAKGPLPVSISIKPGQIAGPSAGLVFSLEIIARMGQDMVNGHRVAGTGVLDSDGRVLPVGGVAQKTIACRETGIEILLVPSENLKEAQRFSGDMRVYGVSSVKEAVELLVALADS